MSIVKQIVDLSGGRIEIRSEIGQGTEIKLSLPLENCSPISEPLEDPIGSSPKLEEPVEAVRRRAKGRKVTIRGFDNKSGTKSSLLALASLKASIENYVTSWFGLEVVPPSSNSTPDIVISDDSIFRHSTVAESKFRSLIILCSNGAKRNISSGRLGIGQTVEFASKPCGPHRLAKALLNCLDAEDANSTAIPNNSEERVSLKRPYENNATPQCDDAHANMSLTAGSAGESGGRSNSSQRLIGNLQSSIGFSPNAMNIIRLPPSHIRTAVVSTAQRPSLNKRASSQDSVVEASMTSSASTPVFSTEESSSSVRSVNLWRSVPNVFVGRPSPPSPPRSMPPPPLKPKMLLVEVRHTLH